MADKEITVFKIGGNVVDNPKLLSKFLMNFSEYPMPKVLVHGGGKKLTQLSKEMGREVRMINGRRVTDEDALELALMVYAGLINTDLVAKLQAHGTNAIGITGADANIIRAIKRPVVPVDFGFVGDVVRVNSQALEQFLAQGLVPVICALTHDGTGQMLNTNADTIAAEVSAALAQTDTVTLIYLFEHAGLLENLSDPESLIQKIDHKGYEDARNRGIIAEGMIPKMDNAFYALRKGVKRVKIGHAEELKKSLKVCTIIEL